MQKLFSLCTHSVYWLHCCGVSLSKFNQHWKDMNRLSSAETIAVHWCQCCIQQYTQIFWITLILHDVFTSGYSSQLLCTRFTFTRAGFSFQTFSWHCSIALHSFVCLFVVLTPVWRTPGTLLTSLGLALTATTNRANSTNFDDAIAHNTNPLSSETNSKVLIERFHLNGPPLGFVCTKMDSSVITQTVPLEWTHRELSFEWSHPWVSPTRKWFLQNPHKPMKLPHQKKNPDIIRTEFTKSGFSETYLRYKRDYRPYAKRRALIFIVHKHE